MKKMIEQLSDTMLEIGGGNYCPLQFHIELKEWADTIKNFQDQVKPLALTEAGKWHGQVYHGYEITRKVGGGRYNYDHIPQVMELRAELKEREKLHQHAYKQMNLGIFLNEQTGEVYEPAKYLQNEDTIMLKAVK
jgi:hypothetical protein